MGKKESILFFTGSYFSSFVAVIFFMSDKGYYVNFY